MFAHEGGGHRWQRVPPTEKRGRVHTSTVTVAVLPIPTETEVKLQDRDLKVDTYRASSAGGQHVQKNETAVRITHLPTGTVVCCENERSQSQNKLWALEKLRARLLETARDKQQAEHNRRRKQQVGSGQRGDKIRTIRTQDNRVTCERTGRIKPYKTYVAGDIAF